MDSKSTQTLISWGYSFRNYVQSSSIENHIKNPILSNTEKWLRELEHPTEVRAENAFTHAKRLYDDFKAASRVQRTVPIGGHTLPPLPYAYNALEPSISERIMTLHHDIHHQSYVDGLNKAELALREARREENFELIKHWERELAFNGAGHYLHTLFWGIMSPDGGTPKGPVVNEITKSFGSFNQFKKQFTNAANKVEGSGWAILVWSPVSRRLEILQAEKHQNLSQWDVIPLLAIDVWEHAYYLQYENNRKQYIDNWWKVVNWAEVNKRFEKARTITWEAF